MDRRGGGYSMDRQVHLRRRATATAALRRRAASATRREAHDHVRVVQVPAAERDAHMLRYVVKQMRKKAGHPL
eukprot:3049035-Prymnesium_polylepis.1